MEKPLRNRKQYFIRDIKRIRDLTRVLGKLGIKRLQWTSTDYYFDSSGKKCIVYTTYTGLSLKETKDLVLRMYNYDDSEII